MGASLVGRVVAGKFAIESLIGSGAMGAVYKARHLGLDKHVAVKVLSESLARDATSAERLRREAKAASRLDHPNSVRVIDFGEDSEGLLYIAMELLDGQDLIDALASGAPFQEARFVDLLCQVLSALAAAHDLGIVHRDLKPENIMVLRRPDDDGRPHDVVKVCDFGIAKLLGPEEDLDGGGPLHRPDGRALTTKGLIIGTPEYMSPEQCRGESLDGRSDLYSVGVILYQFLAGRVPFGGEKVLDILLKHITELPIPPSQIRPGVSPKLEAVCLRALQKDRTARYADAREMRADLRAAIGAPRSGEGVPTPPPVMQRASNESETLASGLAPPAVRRSVAPGRGVRYSLVAALAIIGLVSVVGVVRHRDHASSPPHPPPSNPVATKELAPPPPPFSEALPVQPVLAASRPADSAPAPAPRSRVAKLLVPPEPTPEPPVAARAPEPATASAPSALLSPPAPSVSTSPPALLAPPSASLPSPAPKPIVPSDGRVSWSVSAAGGGATAGNVARALGRTASAWQRCYQTALAASGAHTTGNATLQMTCDDQGRIVGAKLSGIDVGQLADCIRVSSIGVTIPNADTGEAWATVSLTFAVAE